MKKSLSLLSCVDVSWPFGATDRHDRNNAAGTSERADRGEGGYEMKIEVGVKQAREA